MDPVIPAEGAAIEDAGGALETPQAAPVASPASPASQPPAATKPDVASLLSDPELRKELFKHPDLLKEIDHRASSEAGRRAKAELERMQKQQERDIELRRQEEEIAELESMDEYEAGTRTKQQLPERRKQIDKARNEEALQQGLRRLEQDLRLRLQADTGQEVFSTVYALAKEAGATDEELGQLDPMNYTTLGEYVKGSIKFMATREGKKLAKEMAKIEAAALVEEQAIGGQTKSQSPHLLSPGEPAMSNDDFLAAYAACKTNDHKRAKQILGC